MTERFAKIPLWVIGRTDLSGSDWRVYACLQYHSINSLVVFPNMETIAAMTGLRRQDVPRTIRRLESMGLIATEHGGGRSANRYRILLPTTEEADPPAVVSANLRTQDDANGEGINVSVRDPADPASADLRTQCPQICDRSVRDPADRRESRRENLKKEGREAAAPALDSRNETGLSRSAPSEPAPAPSEEDKAYVDARVSELLATFGKGGKPDGSAIIDPAAYEEATARNKFVLWLRGDPAKGYGGLYRFVAETMPPSDERWSYQAAINAGLEAGSREQTPKDALRLLDKLDKRYRPRKAELTAKWEAERETRRNRSRASAYAA